MKNILIVIDMQNGFNRYEQTHKAVNNIVELTNSGIFDTIIATRFLNKEGSQYTRMLNWHRLIDSPDVDIVKGIKYDIVIDKWIYTCVNEDFIKLLQDNNDGKVPTHVFVVGVDIDCCVLKISTDLFEYGIMPLVLTDYCESNGGPESNKAGKLVMNRLIGSRCLIDGKVNLKQQLYDLINERKY